LDYEIIGLSKVDVYDYEVIFFLSKIMKLSISPKQGL